MILANDPQYLLIIFFQAEDGIRDRNVTGVQTCALPIFHRGPRKHDRRSSDQDSRLAHQQAECPGRWRPRGQSRPAAARRPITRAAYGPRARKARDNATIAKRAPWPLRGTARRSSAAASRSQAL